MLLYGRMYLPLSMLEALFIRRLTPTRQLVMTCVTAQHPSPVKPTGSITAQLQHDAGRWSSEVMYASDEALLGVRGLYNFGPESTSALSISAGAEMYYGALNKSAGISTAMRLVTLPPYYKSPMTMTLVCNPLVGHVSASYALKASSRAALCSRFDFNLYSYESDVVLGCEILQTATDDDDDDEQSTFGIIKARIDSSLRIGLVWEGRFRDLLLSAGWQLDLMPLHNQDAVRRIGLSVEYAN